jgi:hypothetical protein
VADHSVVARNDDVRLSLRDCLTQTVERRIRAIIESAVRGFRTVDWVLGERYRTHLEANLAERAAQTHGVRPKDG